MSTKIHMQTTKMQSISDINSNFSSFCSIQCKHGKKDNRTAPWRPEEQLSFWRRKRIFPLSSETAVSPHCLYFLFGGEQKDNRCQWRYGAKGRKDSSERYRCRVKQGASAAAAGQVLRVPVSLETGATYS